MVFLQDKCVSLKLFSFAKAGLHFLFGPLAISPAEAAPQQNPLGFILAFQALPTVIFFSSLMALLYHWGWMQRLIRVFSWIFTRLMQVSGAEALCTSSNIVVGVESVFTVRPYLEDFTLSELCTLLTAGMATIASTVMGAYVGILYKDFPAIAGHLVSASVLSAPAALVLSKLLYPEEEKPRTLGLRVMPYVERSSNFLEAIIKGAHEGVKLLVGICALLLAFLGLLAMFNWLVAFGGRLLGGLWGINLNLSLEKILSWVFLPLSILIGIPLEDAPQVALLLGERSILTELVAYQHLSVYIQKGILVNHRSIIMCAYALCGFSHIASLAIFMGGVCAIVPGRAKDLAKVGCRSFVAATLACLMTSAVCGLFLHPTEPLAILF